MSKHATLHVCRFQTTSSVQCRAKYTSKSLSFYKVCIKTYWKRLSLRHAEQLHAWRLLGSLGGHRSPRQTGRLQASCRLVYSKKALDWDLFVSRWTSVFLELILACNMQACCTTFMIPKWDNNSLILQDDENPYRGKQLMSPRCHVGLFWHVWSLRFYSETDGLDFAGGADVRLKLCCPSWTMLKVISSSRKHFALFSFA